MIAVRRVLAGGRCCHISGTGLYGMREEGIYKLVKKLVEDGIFGYPGEFLNLKDDPTEKGAQFASVIKIIDLNMKRKTGELDKIPLVIKHQFHVDKLAPEDISTMFYNEALMYNEILPALDIVNQPYPDSFFAQSSEHFEEDIIILKNLKTRGYELPRPKQFLDFDHLATCLKSIASLHAGSFSLKSRDSSAYKKLAGQLRIVERPPWQFEKIMYDSMSIGIMSVLKNADKIDNRKALEGFLARVERTNDTLDFLFQPEGFFDAIIHGDYNKNNFFVKYDDDKVIDVAIFDFQFAKHANPIYDLAMVLCLNTNKTTREEHWEDLLHVYWDEVSKTVTDKNILPSFDEFLNFFSCRAVSGYFTTSFFLPMLLTDNFIGLEKFVKLTPQQQIDYHNDLTTQFLPDITDLVTFLLEKRYFHQFNELYDRDFNKSLIN